MELSNLTNLAPIMGIVGLAAAAIIYASIKKLSPGNEKMQEIGDAIHDGAMVFLASEYKILAIFIGVVFLLLFWKIDPNTAWAFLGGAGCSMVAGFFGMKAATRANVRTSECAREFGMGKALNVAFSRGAVQPPQVDNPVGQVVPVNFPKQLIEILFLPGGRSNVRLRAFMSLVGVDQGACFIAFP